MKLIKDLGMLYPKEKSKSKRRFGIYECPVCSEHFKVQTYNVNSGSSTKCVSCARRIAKTTHGLREHRLYGTWNSERKRCNNTSHKAYKNYGGRGIKVSEEFSDFPVWLEHVESLEHAYKDGYTIDRINNDGNYERGNLRWVSKSVQARNTRKIRSDNTSGYRGVYLHKKSGRWQAKIKVNNKSIHLGMFDETITGAKAYDSYVIKHNLEHTRNFKCLA